MYVFSRDGVSEGQFYQVLLYELDAIRKVGISLFPLSRIGLYNWGFILYCNCNDVSNLCQPCSGMCISGAKLSAYCYLCGGSKASPHSIVC